MIQLWKPALKVPTSATRVVLFVLCAQALSTNRVVWAGDTPAENAAKDDKLNENSAENELADLSIEELMTVQVVVTASRKTQTIDSVPYAMSVITKDDIRAMGARSVPDALRLAAGVDVADLTAGQFAVAPRGFHGFLSRQVLVLVDGRQIFDSHFGGTLWGAWPFQLENIERIEVIRGPAGVTWGANAMNGVINVITKDPADQLGTTISTSAGSRGSNVEHVGHAFKKDNLRLRVSGEHESSDGFRKGGSWLGGLDDDYRAGRIDIHAIHEPNPHDKLVLSAGSGVLDGGFPRTPVGGFGWSRNPGAQASFLSTRWSRQLEEGNQLELTGYINDAYGAAGIPQIDYRYQQIALQLGHNRRLSDEHTFHWGIDTRTDLLDASNSDPMLLRRDFVSTAILGAYAEHEWRFAPQWKLSLGGRVDYEFYGGFQPSMRTSVMRELGEHSHVYGAISRAFQMPPVGLRFLEMPVLNGLAWAEGDREIDAELLWAYEIGYRTRILDRVRLAANVFWHEYDDTTTLSPRLGPPGLMTLDLDNRAAASLYGIEVEAHYPVSRSLSLLANYTYQELDWRASVPFHDKDLMSPPTHKAMTGVRWSASDDLHLSSHLYFVDAVSAPNVDFPFVARDIDAYLRWDVRAEYEFWKDHASFAVGARNLLDGDHPEGGTLFLNYAEVPSLVYAEVRVEIRPR